MGMDRLDWRFGIFPDAMDHGLYHASFRMFQAKGTISQVHIPSNSFGMFQCSYYVD